MPLRPDGFRGDREERGDVVVGAGAGRDAAPGENGHEREQGREEELRTAGRRFDSGEDGEYEQQDRRAVGGRRAHRLERTTEPRRDGREREEEQYEERREARDGQREPGRLRPREPDPEYERCCRAGSDQE